MNVTMGKAIAMVGHLKEAYMTLTVFVKDDLIAPWDKAMEQTLTNRSPKCPGGEWGTSGNTKTVG